MENLQAYVQKFAKQIKYVASILNWAVDAIATFPKYPSDESNTNIGTKNN